MARKPSDHQALMDDFADLNTPETYTGAYFDGHSSARHYANVLIVGNHISLLGQELSRREPGHALEASTPARHGTLLLRFSDGAVCELPPTQMLFNRLRLAGVKMPDLTLGVNVLSGNWKLIALVLAFLVSVIVLLYQWLIPAAAEVLAPLVPASVKQSISKHAQLEIERRWFEPTKLSTVTQQNIRTRFADLQPNEKSPLARLELRATRLNEEGKPVMGPNAMALPGGTIYLTDEMVKLLGEDEDAIAGVLAHEMGHVAFDHGTKALIKATALTALGSAVIGDYSSVLATVPAVIGQLKYSREAESQADMYAHQLLCSSRIDPSRTARLFDEFLKKENKESEASGLIPAFLTSHPSHKERARYFRTPCPKS